MIFGVTYSCSGFTRILVLPFSSSICTYFSSIFPFFSFIYCFCFLLNYFFPDLLYYGDGPGPGPSWLSRWGGVVLMSCFVSFWLAERGWLCILIGQSRLWSVTYFGLITSLWPTVFPLAEYFSGMRFDWVITPALEWRLQNGSPASARLLVGVFWFGTFYNPRVLIGRIGFWARVSFRLVD